jgi:sortase A
MNWITHRHLRGSRLRRIAGALLLLAGVLILAEAVVTLAWQEPLGALSARKDQKQLSQELRKAEAAALARPTGSVARTPGRTAALARRYRQQEEPGEPLGRIDLPTIDRQFVFVAGVSARELKKGPGHYPTTALPGEHGTVGIAGHRTTYLAPFRKINQLSRGDRIVVRMPYGRFVYSVQGQIVVSPSNTRSLRGVRHDRLALTTCHPPFSAAKRLVVTAALRSSTLR